MRYIIISNRLPFTVKKESDDYVITESSGGLVTGLSSYLQSLKGSRHKTEYIWLGWPGIDVDENHQVSLTNKFIKQHNSYPVFLTEEAMENFYQGFCNKTIWPLFHYFPTFSDYKEEFWNSYIDVNEYFCKTVLDLLQPGDRIWIHDYHLMLLPGMLRKKKPEISIGFFLHIPFPTYEIYSLLPSSWRVQILEGLLGADLIGFHTHDYTQYFLRCVLRILGKDNEFGNFIINNRGVKADTFPMGIDYEKFSAESVTEGCIAERKKILQNINEEKIILSIDRLDYTKGILNRLLAFETALDNNPGWREKIKLVLDIIPSRIGVDKYETLKHQIDEQVGRINGKFGTIVWTPISYQYGFINFEPLVALYNAADIMLVTPLRDGMNLIAKEYIASKSDQPGVLILSEMAGASKELGEALIINPNYKEEIAAAIEIAMKMPINEQLRRNSLMQNRLKRYNVIRWAEDFLGALESAIQIETVDSKNILTEETINNIIMEMKNSSESILFLDYDGTLVPFQTYPYLAVPTEPILDILKRLSHKKNLDVVLISGRGKDNLAEWFRDLDIYIVAGHGAFTRDKENKWKMPVQLTNSWKQQLMPILEVYVDRLPGAFIEEKEYSLAWHYRNSDPELAVIRKKELIDQLVNITANKELQILNGKKVVEIKNSGVSKGLAGGKLLKKKHYDFIMALGDDLTDEDLFQALPKKAYTVKVGRGHSCAKYYLRNCNDVLRLLEKILGE